MGPSYKSLSWCHVRNYFGMINNKYGELCCKVWCPTPPRARSRLNKKEKRTQETNVGIVLMQTTRFLE